MRDVIVFATIFAALPFALIRPYYGLILFSWLAYMRAPDLCWGPARSFRFSLIVALVMFAGWFLFDKRPFFRKDRRNFYMFMMAIAVSISYLLAPNKLGTIPAKYVEFIKVMAIAVFTTAQIDSKDRLRQIIWVIALSFGFYGIKGGLWYLITQDARIIQGPGGLLKDNNDFSLAMCMNIPFLYYLAQTEANHRVRTFLRMAVAATVVTIVMTGSRGGFLSMVTVFGVITLKSKYKVAGMTAAVFGGLLFLAFIPQDYRERLMTLKTATKEDASAIGRLHAWGIAIKMIKDKPFFGVGFHNFVTQYGRYDSGVAPGVHRVAHNSYFQIWAESGTFAYLFFMATLLSAILLMRRLRRVNRILDGPDWVEGYSNMFETSLYAFLVGATFLNRAHFDFVYQMVAIAAAMYPIAVAEARKKHERTGRTGPGELVIHTKNPFLAVGGSR